MTFSSRAVVDETFLGHSVYVSSDADEAESTWIQPSISRRSIGNAGPTVLDDIYVMTPQAHPWQAPDPDLAMEIEAWDLASDEALALFEAQLD